MLVNFHYLGHKRIGRLGPFQSYPWIEQFEIDIRPIPMRKMEIHYWQRRKLRTESGYRCRSVISSHLTDILFSSIHLARVGKNPAAGHLP